MAVDRGRRLDRAFENQPVEAQRRAWVQRVTYGVQRLRGRLDWALDSVLTRPIASAQPSMRAVLRMGLYEQREMEAPDYAVVSQCVEAARAYAGEGGARLANAILRKLSGSAPDEGFPEAAVDLPDFLATWGSHPRWLVDRWLDRWPSEDVKRLVEANNRIPTIYLRALDGDSDRLGRALEKEGLSGDKMVAGVGCFPIRVGARNYGEILRKVGAFVQDPAAAWVAEAMGVGAGDQVIEFCAAPGGKARALAAAGARVVAGDVSEVRIRLLGAGDPRISRFVGDGRHPPVRPSPFVLLDAPCSGTGTLARHPDGRWRLRPKALRKLRHVQRELMAASATAVAPGGLLVYATCSLEIEENQSRVEQFLTRHPDFSLEVPAHVDPAFLDESGYLEILPQKTGFDGAFAARLRRKA